MRPFEDCVPAGGTKHTAWFLDAMAGEDGVGLVVPPGYQAYVRLLHRLPDGDAWSTVAPQYLAPGDDPYAYPFPDAVTSAEGDLGAGLVDALVPLLTRSTDTPETCHFGLWQGWGELSEGAHSTLWYSGDASGVVARLRIRWEVRRAQRAQRAQRRAESPMYEFLRSCAVAPWWGGRDSYLFGGRVEAVRSIGGVAHGGVAHGGGVDRRSPQWWWPEDRAWFLGNEIDLPWSYLGGSRHLVDAVLADPRVEAVEVDHGDLW